MQLRSLSVRNLRVLHEVDLSVDADLVVFAGPNGSGKSSLLEALHLLGTGRSFRARSVRDVITRKEETLLVRGEFLDENDHSSSVAIEKPRQGAARFRLAGESIKTASALARHLPLVLISADSQRLLSDGAEFRRRLLDWLMFHVEPNYQQVFSRYRRALDQRNAMLRNSATGAGDDRDAWGSELAQAGQALHQLRKHHLAIAQPVLSQSLSEMSQLEIEFNYQPGWDESESLEKLLRDNWMSDRRRGFTTIGPHRADLQFLVAGRPAQHVVSRGEGKVLVFAVMIAFSKVLSLSTKVKPLMLVDELASELDEANRERFLIALRQLGMQTFITTVSQELVDTSAWQRVAIYQLDQVTGLQVLQ